MDKRKVQFRWVAPPAARMKHYLWNHKFDTLAIFVIGSLISLVLIMSKDYGSEDPTLNMVTSVAAIAALASGSLLYINHKWHQRRETIELASKWNDGSMVKIREVVRNAFPLHINPDQVKPFTKKELKSRFSGNGGKELENTVISLLNHLDIVAAGTRKGIFRRDLIYHLYQGIMKRYFIAFSALIAENYKISDDPNNPDKTFWWYLVEEACRWDQTGRCTRIFKLKLGRKSIHGRTWLPPAFRHRVSKFLPIKFNRS